MQRSRRIAAVLLLLGGLLPGLALGQSALAQSSIEDAVVLVRAGITDPASSAKQSYPEGSGFLIDLQGHIITARHVLLKDDGDFWRPGRWVSVSLRHREAPGVSAQIIHCEQGHVDLCLIKISAAAVSGARIGTSLSPSCRHLRRRERIEALGYPMGANNPVLRVRGEITGELATELKYPSDVQIIPGMSGGPVLDEGGKVVAANAAGATGFPTITFLQPLIYGEGLFRRAGVACPIALSGSATEATVAPPCDGVAVAVGSAGERPCIKPGSGQSFRDCPECPEMVVVPAGSFLMGSPPGEEGRGSHEGPQHRVTIPRPFAVGKFEVTFAEWDACVADGGCRHNPHDGERGHAGWGRGRRPVIDVSWKDITNEYLPWLRRKTRKTYRLLTEAEWEYAARAGSTTRFHFGDAERDLCAYGNVADLTGKLKEFMAVANCRDGYPNNTAPVGSFPPNAFGLHDMHGNVSEWVQDCQNANYNDAPTDGSAWFAGDCGYRVLRGGSWYADLPFLRSASRGTFLSIQRLPDLGFRLAGTL